jgi:hypothetical protein
VLDSCAGSALEVRDARGPVLDAERAALASQRLQQRVRVEPAFAGARPRTGGESGHVEPGKTQGQRIRRVELDRDAERALPGDVVGQQRAPRVGREIQVGSLDQSHVDAGPFAVRALDRELIGRTAQELDAELRAAHVDRGRELLANRAGRERRRGPRIGRILLEHDHVPVECWLPDEKVRGRGADDAAADHGDVATRAPTGLVPAADRS